MLAMTRVNLIRSLRNGEGKSISEISEIMRVNWRTAKKYADGEVGGAGVFLDCLDGHSKTPSIFGGAHGSK